MRWRCYPTKNSIKFSTMAICMSATTNPMASQSPVCSQQRRSIPRCISTNRSGSVATLLTRDCTFSTSTAQNHAYASQQPCNGPINSTPLLCRNLPASARCQAISAPRIQQRIARKPMSSQPRRTFVCKAAAVEADLAALKEKFGAIAPQNRATQLY